MKTNHADHQAAYRERHPEKVIEYRNSEAGNARIREAQKRWRDKNQHKIKAHKILNKAVEKGELIRPSVCEWCSAEGKTEGTHTDYDRPLDVEWLCRSCHLIKDGLSRSKRRSDD